jgi:hypothetical protein
MSEKEAYQEKAGARLREWYTWIEQLKTMPPGAQLRQVPDRMRILQRLEDCYQIARMRLEELSLAEDGRWEFAKQAVERAMIELKKAFDASGAVRVGKRMQLEPNRSHVYKPFQK